MATDNLVLITGNVASDPEMRFTTSGKAVLNFRLAHNQRRRNENGEWEDADTSFFNVVAWEQLAENVSDSVTKSMRVTVQGRIRIRTYETEDGETRYVTEIIADEVSPSLRWATAQVTRTSGRGNGGGKTEAYEPPLDEEPF